MKRKRLLTLALVLVTALSLTAIAHADVIAGPAVALYYGARFLPWVLVGAVVGVTVYLLRKYWTKKK